MIDAHWFQCLDIDFRWLEQHQTHDDLLDVVLRLIDHQDYKYITDACHSSIWAVCHAYIDYRLGTSFLSIEELEYTRTRSGVIGISMNDGNVRIATIREFLEEYDNGFRIFMLGHDGPPAA
jgi:hypothetical protein